MCAFPEAGISYSYTVRSLMRGVASLARETGVPIVPVVLWGGQRIASRRASRWTAGEPAAGPAPGPDLVDVRFGHARCRSRAGDDLVDADPASSARRLTTMLEAVQRLPVHRPGTGEPAPWYPAHLGGHAPDRREALLLRPACRGPRSRPRGARRSDRTAR